MIRTEMEYQEAQRRIKEGMRQLKAQQEELEKLDLSKAEIRRGMAPVLTFHEQLSEEVQSYERLRRGDKKELANFQELGQILIALRIVSGLTQRQLAERIGVHETQISRDERNDYHGVTIDRANRLIKALGFELRYSVAPSRRPTVPKRRVLSKK
jgi:ribosome-binding protein aMBF1 (putative translation factor)